MQVCFFACDDKSVLFSNDDCRTFFLDQGLREVSAESALTAAHKITGCQVFCIGPFTCCLFLPAHTPKSPTAGTLNSSPDGTPNSSPDGTPNSSTAHTPNSSTAHAHNSSTAHAHNSSTALTPKSSASGTLTPSTSGTLSSPSAACRPDLPVIYESVLNQVEEGVIISDSENRIIFVNRAAESIEGIDAQTSLGKRMEDLYLPAGKEPKKNSHYKVLHTGVAPHEYLNQYLVKETRKVMNVVERMFPVNVNGKTTAVFSLIKSLPVIQKSMKQGLELYDFLKENPCRNGTRYTFGSIMGNDIRFVEAVSDARRVAQNQTTVLIYGETGTGKELFAQSIHNASPYRNGPFISVNCAAIPFTLLESMFFGTVKGSYTGASNSAGLFEQAHNGTLFLDEVNSMDISLQAKLLKIIENKSVRRIGDEKERCIRCRILCALNEPPLACIESGKLRRDLYYRLSSCILQIPTLRNRKSDIPLLCSHFLRHFNNEYGCHIRTIDQDLMERFLLYPWPGNVRELEHVIESAYSVSVGDIERLQLHHLSHYYRELFTDGPGNRLPSSHGLSQCAPLSSECNDTRDSLPFGAPSDTSGPDAQPYSGVCRSLKTYMDSCEKNFLAAALCSHGSNISATARSLQITRQALQHKIKKYGL